MKIFISYRHSDSSFVGEIFEYLESVGGFDGASLSLIFGSSDPNSIKNNMAKISLSDFPRPFSTQQVISAMNSALIIYETRPATKRVLSLLKFPFQTPAGSLNKSNAGPWRGNAATGGTANFPTLAYSDAQVLLFDDASPLRDNSTSYPRMERRLLPNWPASAGDMGRCTFNSGGGVSWEAPETVVFTGRRLDVGSMTEAEVINSETLYIDYYNLSSAGRDWPGSEFVMQMHSDTAVDGTTALLSAWRQTGDPLSSGIFFVGAGPCPETCNVTSPFLLHTQRKQGSWPSWLRFLFRFRIRKRRRSNKTYIYGMGKAATLRAVANHHFWRAARYRPVRPKLLTLGQLFVGSGGTLEVGWDLRRRAERLVRARLAAFPAGRSPVFADSSTVYALYRGSCRTRSKNSSGE